MRIAPKPVTDSPTTADTTSTSKSSGGSFLDILIQGTQDAVQPAKGSSAQTQSDADSSSQNTPDESQSTEPSAQTTQSGSASAETSQVQTAQAGNSTSTQRSGQTVAGTAQSNTATSQSSATQSLSNLLTMMNLAAANNKAAAASAETAQSAASSNQVAPSGKQAGATKSTQGKQDASTASNSGTTALQQAMIAPPQLVTNPEAVPASGQAVAASSSVQQPSAEQAGSQIAATAALAAEDATKGAARNTINQNQPQAASAQTSTAQTSSLQTSSAQGQQDSSTVSTPATALEFQRDLSAFTATNATTAVPDLSADAGSATQSSNQKATQAPNQTAANTFFSAARQPDDSVTNQTTAKVIPSKISATNLGANSNFSSATPASSGTSASTSVTANAISATTASKSSAQDSSNSSSRDGQGNTDSAANAQAANAVVRTADPGTTTQTAALGTFAATTHATAQSASMTSASDAAPAHTSVSRNVPSEPANASVLAGSSAINSARVIQSMNETEMRVGMRSTEFGDISIRTMVTQQQMQAQISVDHSELVSALTAHIPAVQAKLGTDYGLHASIEVSQGGASFSGNQGQSSQRDYKPFTTSTQMDVVAPSAENDSVSARSTVTAAAVVEGSRLDIRA